MTSQKRHLATQLSFALYGAANRMVRRHKPFLDPFGLTFPQYLVILELLDIAPVSVGALGDRLGMDTGTITPLVKRLETAGMLTRTRDPFDERRVLVDLTEASRALEYELRGITGKIQSTCEMTNSEIDDLRVRLEKLARPAD